MKSYVLLVIILIFISSCKQDWNDIPDTGRKIVINGLITTDSFLNVQICRSFFLNGISSNSGNSGNALWDLDSVDVQFYENNTRIDSLYHVSFYSFDFWYVFNAGNYRSKRLFPQPKKHYKIIARSHNLPEASSITVIPDQVQIINVDTSRIILAPGSYININVGTMCKIEFNDPPEEQNFYLLDIREMVNKDYTSHYNNLEFSCQDPIIEENLFSGIKNEGIAFSDKLINGQKHILPVIIKKEVIGNYTSADKQTVCFRLYSITEEYFRYIRNLNLYSKNFGNPLAEPVILYSNVTGGYGMFTGAAVSSYSIVFAK